MVLTQNHENITLMQLNCLIFILMSEEKLCNDNPITTNYKLVAD